MRPIVLVKQVPDLRGAPIGVRPDGTIDRQAAAAVTNPADLHALEAALSVAVEVWALSMGPPNAEATPARGRVAGASRPCCCVTACWPVRTWATPTPSQEGSSGSAANRAPRYLGDRR